MVATGLAAVHAEYYLRRLIFFFMKIIILFLTARRSLASLARPYWYNL